MCSADVRQRVVRPSWWAWVVVLFLPALALAQVSVEYQTLTLVESAYLYSGLALQSILRLSSLRQLPQVIIACGVVWLALPAHDHGAAAALGWGGGLRRQL